MSHDPETSPVSEAAARRVLLVQAFEQGPADNALWTADDARWATAVARETASADAPPGGFLDQRAQHALERLLPRSSAAARALKARFRPALWALAAALLAFAAGVVVDAVGAGQRVNLLAPPVWAVVAWNLAVYLLLLVAPVLPRPGLARGLRARLAQRFAPRVAGVPAFRATWLRVAAPLLAQRAAMPLHAAAFGLAAGLVASLYLRGLVLDYRAGWQSTFLDAAQVNAVLHALLAAASWLTGIAVPDAAPLRTAPDVLPTASAAPWIHLYAATLLLAVLLPRALLLLAAALRAAWLARRLPLPVAEPYFQRLLRERRGHAALVQVLAHGSAPSPHVLAGVQTLLARAFGSGVQVASAPATAYGDEDSAARIAIPPGTSLRLALVDLAATPESDSHGAFAHALRGAVPVAVLADEAHFKRRFAALPERLQQRRAAWRDWAARHGVAIITADLAAPDAEAAEADLRAAVK